MLRFLSREHGGGTPEHPHSSLNHNPLHFIERNLITGAVVKLCGPRRFVRGDRLGILDRPPVFEICCYPRRPERVAAGGGGESGSNLRRNRPN
jgi:hypothetical protein